MFENAFRSHEGMHRNVCASRQSAKNSTVISNRFLRSICGNTVSGVFRIWRRGEAWRARRARAYNGGLGAEPPAGSSDRAPGRKVRGMKPPPWSWNTFCFWTFNGSRKFAQFLWKNGKNAPFHIKSSVKIFMAKGQRRGASHRAPP